MKTKKGIGKKAIVNGVLVILLLTAIGSAYGATDTSTTLSSTVNAEDPVIDYIDLQQGSSSILGTFGQGNVNTNTDVIIQATSSNGWEYVDYINVSAWFDGGSDANEYGDISGANYKWKLQYTNTTGTGSWSLVSTHGSSEVSYVSATKNSGNLSSENWTVTINWNYQVKNAKLPADNLTSFNEAYTWNIEYYVECEVRTNNATEQREYGVADYTYVSASGNPTGTGLPNEEIDYESDATMTSAVTFRSNNRFNISTQINQTLDDGGNAWASDGSHSIDITNVRVKTDWVDGISTYNSFTALSTPIYLSTATPHGAYTSGNEQSFNTRWGIDVPFGTYPTTYSTGITYEVSVDNEW